MTTPSAAVQDQMRAALKAGDRETVATLRLLLNAMTNERIRSGREVDEEVFLGLVRKAIQQRQEAAGLFRQGGRNELADKEEREAELLRAYLPPQVDEAEIRSAIEDLVRTEGLAGPAAIGPIMKAMLARFAGRTDGSTINRIAREVLA